MKKRKEWYYSIIKVESKEIYQRLCVDEIDYDNKKIIKLCRKCVKLTESEDKTESNLLRLIFKLCKQIKYLIFSFKIF